MNTIFGNFVEKIIPNLKNAILKLSISGKETEMSVEDFKSAIAPKPSYKVYTALLTQSGGNNPNDADNFPLEIGVTYTIIQFGTYTLGDFTNVGAPNNNIGTSFVATGTTPNNWGTNIGLSWNAGAPVVTVLENTIGNIWFEFGTDGQYYVHSPSLFTSNKTTVMIGAAAEGVNNAVFCDAVYSSDSLIYINTVVFNNITLAFLGVNAELTNTPIEIRVYN